VYAPVHWKTDAGGDLHKGFAGIVGARGYVEANLKIGVGEHDIRNGGGGEKWARKGATEGKGGKSGVGKGAPRPTAGATPW